MKKLELEIREAVGTATGRIINGIHPIDAYDHCSKIIKNAAGFNFGEEKSLEQNLADYYTHRGYPQFADVCKEFEQLLKKWKEEERNLILTDIGQNIKLMAQHHGIPEILEVEIKEEPTIASHSATQAQPSKPTPKTPPIEWKNDQAFCKCCGQKLPIYKMDKTGYALSAGNCSCEGYKKAMS